MKDTNRPAFALLNTISSSNKQPKRSNEDLMITTTTLISSPRKRLRTLNPSHGDCIDAFQKGICNCWRAKTEQACELCHDWIRVGQCIVNHGGWVHATCHQYRQQQRCNNNKNNNNNNTNVYENSPLDTNECNMSVDMKSISDSEEESEWCEGEVGSGNPRGGDSYYCSFMRSSYL